MDDDLEERGRWLALRRAGFGSVNFAKLLAWFGDLGGVWKASADELRASGIDAGYVQAAVRARETYNVVDELRLLEPLGVRVFTWADADYPKPLREIPQSPPVLFVRGANGPEFASAVAVVGTRRVTPYGRQVTEAFSEEICRAGLAIISGLARGVDAIAHRAAVERGNPTVAVLAGGIDQVYPRENAGLAERIEKVGCLVSEYPVGIPARPDYFPRRNRILSGLARATLVTEAGAGSGALHTANWAFEQGRDVYAVPGSVFSRQSEGTNALIREHSARLVNSPAELLSDLEISPAWPQAPLQETPRILVTADEEAILSRLESARHIDELVRGSGVPVSVIAATLTVLELKGAVRQTAPQTYLRLTTPD